MVRRLPLAALLLLAVVAWAIDGCAPAAARRPTPPPTATSTPPPSVTPLPPPTVTAAPIIVTGENVTASVLADVAAALRAGAPDVCAALRIACDFPVTVDVYPDQAALDRAVMNPEMRGHFALSGDGRIQIVSPANSGRPELSYEDGVGVAVHEFVHLALDQIAPELPDWLEEGTAVYLGPHALYDRACRDQLAAIPLPTLDDLRQRYGEIPAADLFAYTLVASIVDAHGGEALNALLHAPDDLETTLNLSAAEIEAVWLSFVAGGCAAASPAP